MLLTTILTLALSLSLTNAAAVAVAAPALDPSKPFFLVTTSQRTPTANSSHLAHVSATTVFDPFQQANYLVRAQGPGYNSLPKFFISPSSSHLETRTEGPVPGPKKLLYRSRPVARGRNLRLATNAKLPARGGFGLRDGYLVTVDGNAEGWTLCPGPLGESVLRYKGPQKSCVARFLHAVAHPPY